MTEEERAWKNRFRELAERAYARGRYAFTDFLSLAETQYYYAAERELSYAEGMLWGGYEGAERVMLRFGACDYEEEFPIVVLKIKPLNVKFAEELTHRDYLGALIGLGIERSAIGDIRPFGGGDKSVSAYMGGVYVYCTKKIFPFIEENLHRVRHTDVVCEEVKGGDAEETAEAQKSGQEQGEKAFLSSLRADCAVAAAYKLSRADAEKYFDGECVYINGRLCTRASKELNEGDLVTVRGKGRFKLAEVLGESKKGRLCCRLEKS